GWRRRGRDGGRAAVLLDLEGHGREEVCADVGLSRTVGWFTSQFPVRLDAGGLDLEEALAGGEALGRALKSIKEQLRALPDHGLGYGVLRYLNPQTGAQLSDFAAPQLGFNYLGRFAAPAAADWSVAGDAVRLGAGDAAMPLAHALEVNALTLDGAEGPGLTANWSWAPALVSEAEVRDLAERWFAALAALVRHADAPGAGGRTPSDLPLVTLTQAEIERLERAYGRIEDVLPLSPLQEGLLFHALYDAQAAAVYTGQLERTLAGGRGAGWRAAGACGAGAGGAPCQPARELPARGAWPAGADHRAAADRAVAEHRSVGVGAGGAYDAPDRDSGTGARGALRPFRSSAHALCTDPALGRGASAGGDQPSHCVGWLVDAGAGAGVAGALCARGRRRGAAAGDALPRLSCLDRGAGRRG